MVDCHLGSLAQECDIPNWLMGIIELAIGGSVAVIFFWRQNKQQKKIDNILVKENKLKNERLVYAIRSIIVIVSSIHDGLGMLFEERNLKPTQSNTVFHEILGRISDLNQISGDYSNDLPIQIADSVFSLDLALRRINNFLSPILRGDMESIKIPNDETDEINMKFNEFTMKTKETCENNKIDLSNFEKYLISKIETKFPHMYPK